MPLSIGGRVVDGPKKKLLVIPRDEGDVAFHFIAILDDADFLKVYPQPVPPRTFKPKLQATIDNVEDPAYKVRLSTWQDAKGDWFFLKSIEPSKIEWQSVKMDDPSTYRNWRNELKEAGFSIAEINQIYATFAETNMVTEEMLEDARKRFLALQAVEALAQQ